MTRGNAKLVYGILVLAGLFVGLPAALGPAGPARGADAPAAPLPPPVRVCSGYDPRLSPSGARLLVLRWDLDRDVRDVYGQPERAPFAWVRDVATGAEIHFNLAVLSDEKIPPIKVDEKVRYGEIEAQLLSELIRKTIYAVSDDRTRDVLRGILIEGEKNRVRMGATDGHRLALMEKEGVFGKSVELKKGTIVPKKGAKEIRRLVQELKSDSVVKMGLSDRNVTISEEGETLIVRLIEGEFPDYTIAIPKDNNLRITVKVRPFIVTLKRVTLLTERKQRSLNFFVKTE